MGNFKCKTHGYEYIGPPCPFCLQAENVLLREFIIDYFEELSQGCPADELPCHLEALNATPQTAKVAAAVAFIDHIQAHLQLDEHVICKICNKTVDEIYRELRKGESDAKS